MNQKVAKIPIVFAFDENLILPAAVCISSLLEHANENTYYDIYVLHPKGVNMQNSILSRIYEKYHNFNLSYIEVEPVFNNAYEVRGITNPTYYRLLIPKLLPNLDKVFYSDVDIVFRSDLSGIYKMDFEDNYLAATYDIGMILSKDGLDHISSIGLKNSNKYLQAGFLLMNSKKMREDNLVDTFIEKARNKYKYQDQDILNIVCENKFKLLPLMYNMTDYVFMFLHQKHEYFNEMPAVEISDALGKGTLHYNGHKPWKKYSLNFDVWWEYYRNSPVFDERFYYEFFRKKMDLYDTLTLWKRIKILARYFIHGRLQ
ncbi:MAG: glycosyltransferase family 8 protein [Bacteroidales bacterium]|nr:glycosyltransferase family 8 protein [Bacteroidales bacterium]